MWKVFIVVPGAAASLVGAVVLALIVANLAFLAVAATATEVELHEAHDDVRLLREEREALRILRLRHARGEVTVEEYRRLSFELQRTQPM
ncbi:MAG TPA: hypothetical protein PLJ35_16850 [Anaerolineae bacterium]|nr:hypothetical protein [Anaerolineae bacterium]HPL28360.1 hypothetical protein [Anaerolineae bacterium]